MNKKVSNPNPPHVANKPTPPRAPPPRDTMGMAVKKTRPIYVQQAGRVNRHNSLCTIKFNKFLTREEFEQLFPIVAEYLILDSEVIGDITYITKVEIIGCHYPELIIE